ncbi:MAG: glycosyltransferase [Opitutaceae bacterium]|nr:glycosyltransferase [Opitutaceae bacterium]
MPDVSVILCTHNPRSDFLARTIAALIAQTLPRDAWELLAVDNASDPALPRSTVEWHPRGRLLPEPAIGLTRARIRGIAAAQSALLVFVDDDNVLAPDYLAQALAVSRERPFLGAWGGAVTGEFEVPPPRWAEPYLPFLALRDSAAEAWSNLSQISAATPCGAGLCVRRDVAEKWAQRASNDPRRLHLGRIGRGLGAGEDGDLAFTACDLGLGAGVLPSLRLNHIIPAERLTLAYLERLVEEMSRSEVLLRSLRQHVAPPPRFGIASRVVRALNLLRLPAPTRRLIRAGERGRQAGHAALGAGVIS